MMYNVKKNIYIYKNNNYYYEMAFSVTNINILYALMDNRVKIPFVR